MKIGIESQRIFRKGKHGMDVVAIELIRHLQEIDKKNQYLLFAKDGPDKDWLKENDNLKTILVKGITYADWEQLSLPAAVRKHKPDILHCTANTAPFSCDIPMVLTVHDVIYIEENIVGGSLYQDAGNFYRKMVVPRGIKQAKKIITVSEHEKTVISRVCNINPVKIEVIHNGVDKRFHNKFSNEETAGFRKRYQLPDDFILFLGNTAPKKNTTAVIKAYVHYCSITEHPLPIVIVDFPPASIRMILDSQKCGELIGNFITPGYIPSSQMPLLYNCSSLFLYPSLRESFGLPVIEAMACGIPVIASDIPAIKEVSGDAAMLVDPADQIAIADTIRHLINDSNKRNELREKGLERVKLFNWKDAAEKLIKVYESV
jgi:glycosyltransferase involved in cell wall biosynthesis